MAPDPLGVSPPDDTGTETFRRYRYQAHVAIPFCLRCAAGENILSVIMEHFEDVVVQYEDSWLFIQIKTRNANRGPWRLSDAMGGISSLHRVYRETANLSARYSLFLEGPVDPSDVLQELVPEKSGFGERLRNSVARNLDIDDAECESFLEAVTVRPEQPPRDHIESRNIEIMGAYAPRLSHQELQAVHQHVANELLAAMARERIMAVMPRYIEDPDALERDTRSKVEAKRLTGGALRELMGSVVRGSYLLHAGDAGTATMTQLEQKLLAGGADASTLKSAKILRANATTREFELL